MTKNVLFVSTMETSVWGGSETLWLESAKNLSLIGIPTAASVQYWDTPSLNIIELQENSDVCVLPRNGTSTSAIEKLISQTKPDLVILSLGNSLEGSLWSENFAKHKIPFCLVVHYAAEWEFPKNDLFPKLRNSYSHADHVFFVSKKLREIVENQIAVDLKCKSSIITCPYNMPCNGCLPFPSTSNGLKLACVARLEPDDKGQDLAIKLLASPKWRSRPIELSLYGNGSCSNLVQQLIKFHNSPAVKICGYEPDIMKIWDENHVLFLPSRAEGKPLALMESMLCGRVPAVTDVAGNTELVEDMKTGFVAQYPRIDSLDNMLDKLWQQRDKLSEIAKNAHLKARNHLHPEPGREFAELLIKQFSLS